jgi:hypothetical protein
VGNLRTFLLPPVFESIHRQLVLGAPAGARVDVFLHLITGRGARGGDARAERACGAAPLRAALDLLRPVSLRLHGGASSCADVRFEGPGHGAGCCAGGGLRTLAYLQAAWVDACLAEAAARPGVRYSHFLRTRPDLFVGAPLPEWAFARAHAHTVFTADKDAPGSDMLFLVSRALLFRWWRRVSLRCEDMPDAYLEYYAFGALDAALPHAVNFTRPWWYDRARCAALPCAPGSTRGSAAHAPEPPPDGGARSEQPHLVQLPALRVIVVRSATHVACHELGFYCPPGDALALRDALAAYQCADIEDLETNNTAGELAVIHVPWERVSE